MLFSTKRPVAKHALVGLALIVMVSSCTSEARNDAASSLFIKAVNLKCKVSKSEARLAWSIGEELGADDQARALQAKARQQTDRLLAQVDRLDGPANIRAEIGNLLAQSSTVVKEVSNGTVSTEDGRTKLDDLRQQARNKGLGECVSL